MAWLIMLSATLWLSYLKNMVPTHQINTLIGDYWVYHKMLIEDDEEEKVQPADKAWYIVKFAESHFPDVQSVDRGFHLRIGDTVKFGRVRFKVIMLRNRPDGEQTYRESKLNQKAGRKDLG
jgi:hypothetical protein